MQLVYEKENRLRMMMKMHGLGDGAYWIVMYGWFALLYVAYMLVFVFAGSIMGLNIFTKNDYGERFVCKSSRYCTGGDVCLQERLC
jgi:hypothetical protein